jgi:hypothetical protein
MAFGAWGSVINMEGSHDTTIRLILKKGEKEEGQRYYFDL